MLWPGACINHDTKVGPNTFISPNATLCGFAQVGAHSFIGAGAVIVDHGQVPEASFIKMLARYTGWKLMKTCRNPCNPILPWKGYFDLIHDADEFIFMTTSNSPRMIGATATGSKHRTARMDHHSRCVGNDRLICDVKSGMPAGSRNTGKRSSTTMASVRTSPATRNSLRTSI